MTPSAPMVNDKTRLACMSSRNTLLKYSPTKSTRLLAVRIPAPKLADSQISLASHTSIQAIVSQPK